MTDFQTYRQDATTTANAGGLVSGRTVQGTKVYSEAGEELGHVDDVRIDAASGKIVYGVLQFGGFLGIGSDYYPIPFGRLRYDHQLHGYVTNLTREQLEGAPRAGDSWYEDRAWQEQSHRHYGVNPYWI